MVEQYAVFPSLPDLVWVVLAVGLVVFFVAMALPFLNLSHAVSGHAAHPPVLAALADQPEVTTLEAWQKDRVPFLKRQFQEHIYGTMPKPVAVKKNARNTIVKGAFGGLGTVEEVVLKLGDAANAPQLNVILVTPTARPKTAKGHPTFLVPNICGNHRALPKLGVPDPKAWYPKFICEHRAAVPFAWLVFGANVVAPPTEQLLKAGYALAVYTPGQVVPDSAELASGYLANLPGADQTTGAIAAWAWAMSRVVDVVTADERLNENEIIAYGHSRHGKAALLATVFDERIRLLIAHQSGTAGASLARTDQGESIKEITASYPHWFSPKYATYHGREDELPFDQHHLLAMAAPRPVFLGNGRRDQWSDPHGSFLAAQGVAPVYKLFGNRGMNQQSFTKVDYSDDVALFMRSGFHGVYRQDWQHFIKFADSHLARPVQP